MDRVAVFVDAGYLFAQGGVLLSGKKLPRGSMVLDHEAAIKSISDFATQLASVPLLRVYWYDGTSTGPTAQHLALAHLSDTKVRLGFVNSVGEQKGVDSLIVTDMIALARNHAISDAVLVSGDEDLRVGVQQAQEFGVRVHLVGIRPSRGSQSLFLMQEADTTHEWHESDITPFLRCREESSAPELGVSAAQTQATVSTDPIPYVAKQVAGAVQAGELETILQTFEATRQLPRPIDGRLLGFARGRMSKELDSGEKKKLRQVFIDECRSRVTKK
jgi:hypothetical protein